MENLNKRWEKLGLLLLALQQSCVSSHTGVNIFPWVYFSLAKG